MQLSKLREFLEKGIDAMNEAGRASDADGVSRTIELLYERSLVEGFAPRDKIWGLEISQEPPGLNVVNWVVNVIANDYLNVAESDFQKAIKSRPIHGFFGGLRLVVERKDVYKELSLATTEQWLKIHRCLLRLFNCVWELAKPSLCFDSPEGYMPAELEDEEDEDMNTQTVMSYSWRAVKESRYLLYIELTGNDLLITITVHYWEPFLAGHRIQEIWRNMLCFMSQTFEKAANFFFLS
jgi:hypothetical protein